MTSSKKEDDSLLLMAPALLTGATFCGGVGLLITSTLLLPDASRTSFRFGLSLLVAAVLGAIFLLPFANRKTAREPTDARPEVATSWDGPPEQQNGVKPDSVGTELPKAPSAKPAQPPSPRTAARALVGNRLSEEQVKTAAEKILALQPYVTCEKDNVALEHMWSFFDMPIPEGLSFDPQHRVIQALKAKLNRQRLLFHPDKNCHPDAEKTFKFLEVCHQKLVKAFVRQRHETVHQRTRREEEELKQEEERRRKQEEERRHQMAIIQKEEEERQQFEEEQRKRAEMEKQRLQAMLQAKNAAQEAREKAAQIMVRRSDSASFFGVTCIPNLSAVEDADMLPSCSKLGQPVGLLTVQLLAARDLPPQVFLLASNAFASISVGEQRFDSAKVPGCNPKWNCFFKFNVHRVDTSLCVSVHREGWFEDTLLGKLEIPFLDLEEWSGHQIGRVLETVDAEASALVQCMVVELKASFEWF
eukprot:TRINITY_DN5538_c0_g1_i2.p1 TRINITY_DN5538_c0_g1~~TRINITY_DN5538_c0_g1_i2.p1  ORF type:complete len:473 (-),score=95.28 TRINITY_DN5538_c0_g1_i2:53-1471(-)